MSDIPESYEAALRELNQLMEELQSPAASIDQMEARLRRAATLIQYCKERLHTLEDTLSELFPEAPPA